MKTRRTLTCLALMLYAASGWGAFLEPPLHKPDWWKVPGDAADGATRTLYRSFVTDPELPHDNGDYTYNGFSPSIADAWTDDLTVGVHVDYGPDCPAYGDRYCLEGPVHLDVTLGNRSWDGGVKWYFVQIVGRTLSAGDHHLDWITTEDNVSQPWMDPDFVGYSDWVDCDNDDQDDLCVLTFTGKVLVPQPDWETFSFTIAYDAVDSMWIGTHCVPEPATLALTTLGLGALASLRRRRRV